MAKKKSNRDFVTRLIHASITGIDRPLSEADRQRAAKEIIEMNPCRNTDELLKKTDKELYYVYSQELLEDFEAGLYDNL
jgi:predicted nuclease with RNAse H fold